MDKTKRNRGAVKRQKESLRLRDGDLCYICGKPMSFNIADRNSPDYATMDHLLPRCLGGKQHLDNLKLAHQRCNLKRAVREKLHRCPPARAISKEFRNG